MFWIIAFLIIMFLSWVFSSYCRWQNQDRQRAELLGTLYDIRRELASLNADAAERRRQN